MRRILAALSMMLVIGMSPANARGWAWFVHNIKPGTQCPGHPVATTMYGDGKWNADRTRFNPHGLSIATYDYPFGTVLRVTNCSNGRSVHVVVKDRGPAAYQRSLGIRYDLSLGAARAIALGQQGRFESGYTSVQVVSGERVADGEGWKKTVPGDIENRNSVRRSHHRARTQYASYRATSGDLQIRHRGEPVTAWNTVSSAGR